MLIQQITPEVLQWICAQAQAGHKPDAVMEAMRASGWQDDVARSAIERAKRGSLVEAPPRVPVPDPASSVSPWTVSTSDRQVKVLASMQLPRVVVFGSLLSDEECDSLVELARAKVTRSPTFDNWSGGNEVTEGRTSEGMCFTRGENDLVKRIETRIAELVRWPVERGEGMQVLRYGPGAEYRPHHDYFDPTVPGAASLLQRGGGRVATLVMYLKTSQKGGSTTFPDVGFEVAPIKGNAVFFSYDCPHPMTRTLHGGAPVIEGEKWIATKWLRESVFT